ncbi:abnormal spindle-like microcephaly-associated protein isoform X2 [Nerophis ophidion]|uniref:abnormal spindle-like microcephaly-associated protein isoform X2 n=1 Tax=Nerophis ophidion TaxID=159077 RepID=UPI002ADFA94F|nr:abnormal spindle-like microcephaly-associated protein isoform X2 [Nerophis ophidion]
MPGVGTLPPGTFMDFSPRRRSSAEKENEIPVLSLVLFSKAPFVSFGTVKVGTSKSAVLRIENPDEDAEVEVIVDKIPSGKGFSVNQTAFTIQPQGAFSLTITWTPTEEGGIRELIIFIGNRVLKHQAVLLGRAEVSKKKKKSLWDAIKNKRGAEKGSPYKGKRTEPPTKMAANKTVQVSRKPQHKRDRLRSPLSSLNEGKPVREKLFHKHSHPDDDRPESEQNRALNPTYKPWSLADQENVRHVQMHSSPVLATQVTHMSTGPGSLVEKPENKVLAKMLNTTLSPIGTPERFKEIMPRIKSVESHVIGGPALSLTEALALIDSNLSPISSSPRDTSSNSVFSDSLESKSDNHERGRNENVGSPEMSQSTKHGLTFSQKAVKPEAVEIPTKLAFNCETVIKKKAPASERKIKKSKRRLMEKTLELTESRSHSESGPGTPSLPVIQPDWTQRSTEAGLSCVNTRAVQEFDTSSTTQKADASPSPIALPAGTPKPTIHWDFATNSPTLDAPLMTFTATSPSSSNQSSEPDNRLPESSPTDPSAQLDSFPIHVARKSIKRKSEEYLKSALKIDAGGKTEPVKRTRTVLWKNEPAKPTHERTMLQKQQAKSTGSVHSMKTSLKTAKSSVPAQAKTQSTKLASQGAGFLRPSREFRVKGVKSARVAAIAQSKLTFIKPAQTAIPRHPLPFAAKNMFYDERWIEKQERGFTWWLNYVLTPDDFKVNTETTKVSAASLTMGCSAEFCIAKAPTKEEMSFSTYTARRKLNRLRRAACQLFTSETLVKAIKRLEIEVEAKRLLIRKDRHLWKDIGERQKVLNWLLSYNPLWLRIGLETIFGELISLEDNSDVMGLAMFILQRLLWNPDIAAEFRHPKVPHLYKDGHEEALSCFTLKKLLLLVCFLDKAKESRLMEHDPCLFCMDAEFKKSKDLLLAFSRDFLSGEGILPRHLGYLGLPVSHVQTPLDEFNFAVGNLSVDLKCGIRLVRVMELLTKQWALSAKLRLPAISRLQKVHNVDITFQVLKSRGVDLKDELGHVIDSRDIVDGHREKTLSLLWKIIFSYQVEVILDDDLMREEIAFLRRTLRTKQRSASLKADRGPDSSAPKTQAPYEHSSTKVALLMEWTRSVCDFYNLKVENFTVTFSDGRVLCYLIHHYHPGLIPERSVHLVTTQTAECSSQGRLELDCSATESDNSFDNSSTGQNGPQSPSVEFKELLENEKSNFRLVNNAVAFLGGVPAMINPADMSNTIPNEKVVMSYLSFLCARLLDLRNETRAARIIQGAWRKYSLKKDLHLYKAQWRMFSAMKSYQRLRYYTIVVQAQWRMKKAVTAFGRIYRATIVIQRHLRARILARKQRGRYLLLLSAVVKIQRGYRQWKVLKTQKENHAARVVQAVFRKWHAEKMTNRASAAVKIQSWYRMKKCLYQYKKFQKSSLLIQAYYRAHVQRRNFQRLKQRHNSAIVIQSVFRGYAVRNRNRTAFLQKRVACVILQAGFRGMRIRTELKKKHKAATVIQSAVRMFLRRKRYILLRSAAITIQCRYKALLQCRAQQHVYREQKKAAITIQAVYRAWRAKEEMNKRHHAARVIQAKFKMYKVRMAYLATKCAAVIIQERFRAKILMNQQRKMYRDMKSAAVIIQAAYRGRQARTEVMKMHRAAMVIQRMFHTFQERNRFLAVRTAVLVFQQRYRAVTLMRKVRTDYLSKRVAAVCLQSAFRGYTVRKQLIIRHKAAVTIQSNFRKRQQKRFYRRLQRAVGVLQGRYRANKKMRHERLTFRAKRHAAIVLQAAFRGMRSRRIVKQKHQAAATIQRAFRARYEHKKYLALKSSVLAMQRRYRTTLRAKAQMRLYQNIRKSAVIIQAAYRGMRARKNVVLWHRAATVIQSVFRRHKAEVQFQAMRLSAVIIQTYYRAYVRQKRERELFVKVRSSAIVLQAAFRGYSARREIAKMQRAATVLQAAFRKHKQQSTFRKQCWAACVLQQRFRALKQRNVDVGKYNEIRKSVVCLQAAFRGRKARQSVRQMHQAATTIQKAFRARCEHKKYLALKTSVLAMQRRYRATVAAKSQRQHYQNMKEAVEIIQAAYRGMRVRNCVARWHQAAIVIQSAFRRHREETKFQAMRLSAVIVQRYFRAYILQKQDRRHYFKVRSSTIVLQAAFRGHCARRRISKMHRAATVLQANFKRHKQQMTFRKQCWAASVLQQRFRALKQKNVEVTHYQELKKAVISLQAAFRGMKLRQSIRQMHQAAIVIQSAFRRHREEIKFQAMRLSAITIQRYFRAYILQKQDRRHYFKVRSSAIVLQAAFRGHCVRRRISKMHRAATVLQANFKRHKQQMTFRKQCWAASVLQQRFRALKQKNVEVTHYQEVKKAVISLQAAFRGMKLRQSIRQMHQAAIVIQSAFRRHREEIKFQAMRLSAITIQRYFRAYILQKQDRRYYFKVRSSVIVLQAAFRAYSVRRRIALMHRAATVLQANFKRHKQQMTFRKQCWAVFVLQQRFRAFKQKNVEVKHYQELKKAVISLQAAFRGMKLRQTIRQMHQAATTIQNAFRAHCEHRKYLALKSSVLAMQRRYRATMAAKAQMQNYQNKKKAAVIIQAAYKGMQVRNCVARWHQAAIVIQSAFRRHREETKFQAMRLSAIIIQRYFRAYVLQKQDRRHYFKVRSSAIVLQAAFRAYSVRRRISKMHRAATVLQANFKRHKQQMTFRKQRWAVFVLQQRFRALKQKNVEVTHYQELKKAVISLQAAFRGMKLRQTIRQMHQAAIVIQSAFRRHREEIKFQAMRLSAITIQRYFRAYILQKQDRRHYFKVKSSVIVLQAAFRGHCARRRISKMHRAATVLQANFKRHKQQMTFRKQRWAASVLQQRFRALKQKNVEVTHYQELKKAVISLQAAFRGMKLRQSIRQMHQAAIVIQSAFRRHREEIKFQAMRLSAITIQRYFRAYILQKQDRRHYFKVRSSVMVLQAAFRGHCARRRISKMHRAATVLQANFKRHKQQMTFRKQCWAVSVLQQRFRAFKQKNVEVKHYQELKKAVISLQAAFRGMKLRQSIRQMHQAATTIQNAFRAHCEHKKYLALKSSVLAMQQRYRATVAAKAQMQNYQNKKKAVGIIQAAYKGMQVRNCVARWHEAAIVIQSAFRRHREETKFQAMRLSAIIIQRYFRAYILQKQDRRHYFKVRSSTIVLQAAFRGHCARRRISKMHRAATVLQANFKRHKQQMTFRKQRWAASVLQQRFRAFKQKNIELKRYQEVKKAVISLQAAFRGMKSRQSVKLMHQAATTIQTAFRAHREMEKYLRIKSSVLTIQRQFQATVAAKVQRKRFLDTRRAAIVFQATYRGQHARKHLAHLHWAATIIQTAYRKHVALVKFQEMRASAVVIQRFYRAFNDQRQERNNFLKILQSTVIIQAAFKGYSVRRHIHRQSQAASFIQSYWRCFIQRRVFLKKREAAVKLQQKIRAMQLGKLDRNKYVRIRQAAITLQTRYRAWTAQKLKLEAANVHRRLCFAAAVYHHLSAIKIQRALRAHWALESAKRQIHIIIAIQRWVRVKQQKRRYLEDRRKVVTAQRAVRRWLTRRHKAASVIQDATRRFLLLRRQRRRERGIVKAQALWRGHCSRRLNDNDKIIKLRQNLRKVSLSAREEDKLCNKTFSALDCILRYKHFSHILKALENLEATTRLSPVCCEQLVDRGATCVIFTLIRSCNRSVSCMDVISFSIQILLNLAKYHKTIEAVYSVDNSVDTLGDLLLRYRGKAGDKVADKGGSIFTKASFLLLLLLQDKKHVGEVMNNPKMMDRLRGIYRLTVHKHKVDAERSVTKQKMNASINGSFYVQQTPRKSRPVPKFAPDWVLRKDAIKDIVDPLMAIQMVANTLFISL